MDLNSFIFNSINTTNKALFVYDADNEVLNNFIENTPVAQLLVIGDNSNLQELSFNKFKHSITHLDNSIEEAYLDHSLNSPVDLIYIDATVVTPNNLSMLSDCFDKNTTSFILKFQKGRAQSYSSNYLLNQVKEDIVVHHINENIGYVIYVP